MSKSLGNFFTIREVLQKYQAEVVRFFILRAHYRSPLNYSDAHLDDARNGLDRLYTALKGNADVPGDIDWSDAFAARFRTAMEDDFNTPEAVAVLFDLAGEVNRTGSAAKAGLLRQLGGVLGLLQSDATVHLRGGSGAINTNDAAQPAGLTKSIDDYIAERNEARKSKNFARADEIRKLLLEAGVVLEDSAGATTWRRA